MKKIFTCIFCAVLAISSWGTETVITIGSGTSSLQKLPTSPENKYSITQFIYLASEIGFVAEKSISKIAFNAVSTSANYTRNLTIYIEHTAQSTLSGWNNVTSSALFSGNVEIPAAGGWYTITLSNAFVWNGTDNILISIADNTNRADGEFGNYKKHYTFNESSYDRSYGAGGNSKYDPTNVSGYVSTRAGVPQIKMTFTSATTKNPTLNVTPTSVSLGTFDKQYETISKTFVVKGSNLTSDVFISSESTDITISPASITKEVIVEAGDNGIEVTVSNTNMFDFTKSHKVTVASTDAISQELSISATQAEYQTQISYANLYNSNLGSYSSLTGSTPIASVDASAQTFVIGSGSNACTIDYSAVPGAYTALGKVSNLKVKKTGEGFFKAFAFDYNGPVVTVITIDENADNSETLAEEAKNVNVTLNRAAFQKNMFNTFCVPFDISKTLVEIKFAGCDIITLASSAYNDGVISLTFKECDQIEAGQPYLINPKDKDISFTFNSCNIQNIASGSVETKLVDFIGIVNPTDLPQSKEILFMGQNNELFWPTEAGTLKGMRCYFKVNFEGTPEGSAIAGSPVRMSIINSDGTTTDLPTMWAESNSPMIMYKNQLFVIKDNKLISISGQTIQ